MDEMLRRYLTGLFLVVLLLFGASLPLSADAKSKVLFLRYEGPVTPAMFSYLERGLSQAETIGAEAVIFAIDTPGGSVDVTRQISQVIQQSPVPVIVYVYPPRAWAASAGTLITLSGHLAAMAPETFIGAAAPVGSSGEDLPETAKQKAEEALSATARALAARRGEAAVTWASQTVLSAEASTAEEALKIGAIDVIARDVPDLLRQLDGAEVTVNGVSRTLHLASADVIPFDQNFLEELLGMLSNPAIAVVLLTLGLNALLYELSAPGGYVAGAVGIIALLLAFYSLGTLDANYAGFAFILLAFALFVIDLKVHTGGVLTVAGLVAFVLGSAMLFGSSFVAVPWGTIIGVALAMGLFVAFALQAVVRAQRAAPFMGGSALQGVIGDARTELAPEGIVFVRGARWEAISEEGPIEAGAKVQVVSREGNRLRVRKAEG